MNAGKQLLRQPHDARPLWKGPQKQQRVMEPDERWGVAETKFAGGDDEFPGARSFAATEAPLAFFEANQDTLCARRWHKVTKVGRESILKRGDIAMQITNHCHKSQMSFPLRRNCAS
jgi:hypothetical protein